MKKENVLIKLTIDVEPAAYKKNGQFCILEPLTSVDKLYSYVTYANYSDEKLSGWTIVCHISQTDFLNTISVKKATEDICKTIEDTISKESVRYVIGYAQPPLELLLETLEPLVKKLALEQRNHWPIEFEDLCQMCRLCICTLYRGGYYVHKALIRRTFINSVLQYLKPDRYKPLLVSLDNTSYCDESNNRLTIEDTLIDYDEFYKQEDLEDEQVNKEVLDEMKKVVVDIIGQRQYDQMLREYGNKMTTNWSRKTMQTIKNELKAKGIDVNLFRRYY